MIIHPFHDVNVTLVQNGITTNLQPLQAGLLVQAELPEIISGCLTTCQALFLNVRQSQTVFYEKCYKRIVISA